MKESSRWPILLIVTVIVLLFANLTGWQIDDDEGTALYASWRVAEGDSPYIDFTTTKAPIYLLVGGATVRLFGNNLFALRTVSTIAILLGVSSLTWAIRKVWGSRIALLMWAVVLLTPQIYWLARRSRADSLMLAFVLLALTLLVWEIASRKRSYLIVAGVVFGLAMLSKLVALMSVLGAFIWLSIRTLQTRQWHKGLGDLLAMGIPFLAVVLIGYALVNVQYPGAMDMLLGAQSSSEAPVTGEGMCLENIPRGAVCQLLKVGIGWLLLISENWILVPMLPMLFLTLRRWRDPSPNWLWVSQVLGSGLALALGGPIFPRYFIYLIPSLTAVWLIDLANVMPQINKLRWSGVIPLALILPILFAIPQRELLLDQETDTQELASWIQANTQPGDVVLTDYAALNFHAEHPSVPLQGGVGGGWALSGLLTGAKLIEQLEAHGGVMVVLHVEGGQKNPTHMAAMHDFDEFYAYLQANYELVAVQDRQGQQIEIWQRPRR